jgi:hypothetical protein
VAIERDISERKQAVETFFNSTPTWKATHDAATDNSLKRPTASWKHFLTLSRMICARLSLHQWFRSTAAQVCERNLDAKVCAT